MTANLIVHNMRRPVQHVYKTAFVYVGRPDKKGNGSVLGNPFIIGKDGSRSEVIRKYKAWLWKHMQNKDSDVYKALYSIGWKALSYQTILLGCWCSPEPCHAEMIRDAVNWMIKDGQIKAVHSPNPHVESIPFPKLDPLPSPLSRNH